MVAVGIAVVVIGDRSNGATDWGGAAAGGPLAGVAVEDSLAAGVLDAQTIELAGGQTVRLIGVEAPEANECYGPEALARTHELLPPGTPVKLEYDVERRDEDRRTLAYVYRLEDGLFVNLALARDGFAREWIAVPNLAHVADLVAAVAEAESQGLGLWGACQGAGGTRPAAAAGGPVAAGGAATAPAPAGAPAGTDGAARATSSDGCHPSYAGACVPVDVPDVDCAGAGDGPAFVSGALGVVGPDVYQLDPDLDGIACDR